MLAWYHCCYWGGFLSLCSLFLNEMKGDAKLKRTQLSGITCFFNYNLLKRFYRVRLTTCTSLLLLTRQFPSPWSISTAETPSTHGSCPSAQHLFFLKQIVKLSFHPSSLVIANPIKTGKKQTNQTSKIRLTVYDIANLEWHAVERIRGIRQQMGLDRAPINRQVRRRQQHRVFH